MISFLCTQGEGNLVAKTKRNAFENRYVYKTVKQIKILQKRKIKTLRVSHPPISENGKYMDLRHLSTCSGFLDCLYSDFNCVNRYAKSITYSTSASLTLC